MVVVVASRLGSSFEGNQLQECLLSPSPLIFFNTDTPKSSPLSLSKPIMPIERDPR